MYTKSCPVNVGLRISSLLGLLLLSQGVTMATVIHVGPGMAFTGIRPAIAKAGPGDTILVQQGVYREGELRIDRPVTLLGVGLPSLDGEGRHGILTVRSDSVSIVGFRFVRSGRSGYLDIAALRVENATRIRILRNRFEDSFFGIYLQEVSIAEVRGNTLHSNARDESASANGIHCWRSDNLLIAGNDVSGHRDGIYFEFVTRSRIEGNRSHGNVRYGLHFMFSGDDIYLGNVFSGNGAGVSVMFSRNVSMLHNRFSDNRGEAAYGILMKEISDGTVEGNRFQGNTVGILLEGSNRIRMQGNLFDGNGWAIRMQASCQDIRVQGNNFTANTFDVATNGSLVMNTLHGNYWERYEGYDLNRDGVGDVPHRPASLFSMIVERNPAALMLFRSLTAELIDRLERILPDLTPGALMDDAPSMRRIPMRTNT